MAKNVTKSQVNAAARKPAEHLWGACQHLHRVRAPGYHSGGWTLAAEEGAPYEWTIEASEVLNGSGPVKVFSEPVNHWCLGLYPA
jgi:hypothetical protein